MNKDKIWNSKTNWFSFKFSFIFLGIGILFTILNILETTIWRRSAVISLILMFVGLIFYSLFFAPIYIHVEKKINEAIRKIYK